MKSRWRVLGGVVKLADATLIVSGILVAPALILFAILGVVLYRQRPEPESETPAKSKPKPTASSVDKPTKRANPKAKKSPLVQPLEAEEGDAEDNGRDDENLEMDE